MSTTTTTSSQIIHHATAFISETLSQSDLRHRVFSAFTNKIPSSNQIILKPLHLAAETLENAISTSNPSIRSSSLRLAEKLLVSFPENPFSSFLLSLIHSLCHRPIDASLSLLDVFYIDPSLARSEVAPVVFEELFLIHFLPVFNGSMIIDRKFCLLYRKMLVTIVMIALYVMTRWFSSTRSLSQMSGDQTSELKELERDYEEVLDENCRVFAGYFKEVLANKDGNRLIDPPSVVLEKDWKKAINLNIVKMRRSKLENLD
ncbi:putative E3 ubiquitin-protein ligase LIN-1 [Camellia lanceoleosa]|uniref:E3 ubiquitin-protein ligase LIN-1 n=1 Tax=Camellia lanceoleosa TaxID=1840588 RepID=A0ACC0FMP3_9ERIC|nr:putative E3 ubiquitin-protein ligase LIN-1 [Camellia lanceoleosa]